MLKIKYIFQFFAHNIYCKTFYLSFGSVILSYLIVVGMAIFEGILNFEILLNFFLIIFYIWIYKVFYKKYIHKSFSKSLFIIPGIFLLLVSIPFLDAVDEQVNKPSSGGHVILKKPLIYLYPEVQQDIKVGLEVKGEIIADYPKYNEEIKGWEVTAYPDGKIIENGKEYSYLFWESQNYDTQWDLSKGFIVEGKDTREFLEEKLSYIGLTPKEYNEFIVYWYPLMMNNKYNLVYFAGTDYTDLAPLDINPKPDSMLRVFTVIKPLEEKIAIEEQRLEKFERKGFSVVEWGGTILD